MNELATASTITRQRASRIAQRLGEELPESQRRWESGKTHRLNAGHWTPVAGQPVNSDLASWLPYGGEAVGHHARGVVTTPVNPHTGLATGPGGGEVQFDDWALTRLPDYEFRDCVTCAFYDCLIFEEFVNIDCHWQKDNGDWFNDGGGATDDSDAVRSLRVGHPGVDRDGFPEQIGFGTDCNGTGQSAT